MLDYEFDKLMGAKSTEEEYNMANCVYMASDMDKEPFCEMWKGATNEARVYMYEMAKKQYGLENKVAELKRVRESYACMLVDGDGGSGYGTDEAVRLMGRRWVVLHKVSNQMVMTRDDVAWMEMHLSE